MVLNNSLTELNKFVIENNIVGTSAGVCVALAAKDSIQSLVDDIIMPTAVILLTSLNINSITKFMPVDGHTKLNISNFIKQMITFFLIIVISFLFVKFSFGYLLGISNDKTNKSMNVNNY